MKVLASAANDLSGSTKQINSSAFCWVKHTIETIYTNKPRYRGLQSVFEVFFWGG